MPVPMLQQEADPLWISVSKSYKSSTEILLTRNRNDNDGDSNDENVDKLLSLGRRCCGIM